MGLQFTVEANPAPASDERVAEVLGAPGFGRVFTDHLAIVRWNPEHGWHDAKVQPYGPLSLDPATHVFHYSQTIFEGFKAYRQPDGSIATFRPHANGERLNRSAKRMALPSLPVEDFVAASDLLVRTDERWVPSEPGMSLYLRPLMMATEVGLGVRPANDVTFLVIASPAASYFAGGAKPVSIWVSEAYTRAAPGGTGAAKTGGNYAASLVAQQEAIDNGCEQVLFLDAVERRWLEEFGGMNAWLVLDDGSTPSSRCCGTSDATSRSGASTSTRCARASRAVVWSRCSPAGRPRSSRASGGWRGTAETSPSPPRRTSPRRSAPVWSRCRRGGRRTRTAGCTPSLSRGAARSLAAERRVP